MAAEALFLLAALQLGSLDVRVDAGEAEAVLAILDARSEGRPVSEAAFRRLFASAGYRRLREREAAMGRAFTDAEFREFVLSDDLLAKREASRAAVDAWRAVRPERAAASAARYLPAGTELRATIYPVIKPRTNSFVFDLESDPAIFFYVDPSLSKGVFENTMTHELHHVGYAAACADPASSGDEAADAVRRWVGAFGEGLAMLAAAGGPEVHPHASSPAEDRERWDRDVARFDADLKRVERFFLDILEGKLVTDAERLEAARSFYGVQGPWYTVGWKMAVVIERAFGRERLVATICDPVGFLELYNEAAAEDAPLPRWSPELLRRIDAR